MLGLIVLPCMMGVNGVWLAVPAAELLTLGVVLFLIERNKDHYKYVRENK